MSFPKTNTRSWVNAERNTGRGAFLRHLLYGSDLDTGDNPRFKRPMTHQFVASNTSTMLTLNMDYNGIAFDVDTEATTADAVNIQADTITTALALDMGSADALTTGGIFRALANGTDTSTRTLGQITNDNTSATGTTLVSFQQDAAQRSLFIDHNAITGAAIYIDGEQTTQAGIVDIEADTVTTGWVFNVDNLNGATGGGIFNFIANGTNTSTRTVGQITNDNTSATGATVLQLQQDAAQRALFIDANGATGAAVYIDSEATTQAGIIDVEVDALTTGRAINLDNLDGLTTGYAFYAASAAGSGSTRSLIYVANTSVGATGTTVVELSNAATGTELQLTNTTAGTAGAKIELYHNSASPATNDVIANLLFTGEDDNGSKVTYGTARALIDRPNSGSFGALLSFSVSSAGAPLEVLRVKPSGSIGTQEISYITDSTGTADVFDGFNDLAIASMFGPEQAMREEFYEKYVEIGVADRGDKPGTYWIDDTKERKLFRGTFKQIGTILQNQEDRIADLSLELGNLREFVQEHVAPQQLN